MKTNNRDYNSISPSAKVLLLVKGVTQIPFAKEVAGMMTKEETDLLFINDETPYFWGRVVHFENRYWSIDQLLKDQPVNNILELSSGFSFRGLDKVLHHKDCHYIDTDLPGIIAMKRSFVDSLIPEDHSQMGNLEMLGLNALDDTAFESVIKRFDAGEVAIVNEGLLMYLDTAEKRRLCHSIRRVLEQHGGYWITADIYIKREMEDPRMQQNDPLNKFFEQHNIRENMFDSFEAAEAFFKEEGFVIDREATLDPSVLTGLAYFRKNYTDEQMAVMSKAQKIQATWRLKLAG